MYKPSDQISWIFLCCMCLTFSVFAQAPKEAPQQSQELVLDLGTALSRALNYNRQLIGTSENITDAQYSIEFAKAEFDVQIAPNSRAGFIGGGHEGAGFSLGGGIDFSKKFQDGTQIGLGPSILKTKDHYSSEMEVIVTQPLLRGLGRDYQLSGVKGAQFSMRAARRNLYIAQMQLSIRTITALYDIIKAQKAVALGEESLNRISAYYQTAKLKEKIGLSDALDVYRAEIELRQAEDTFVGAQERLEELEDNIRDLLALPLDTCFKVEVPLVYTKNELDSCKAIELALGNRIEIDQGIDQWKESYRLATVAKKDLLPELNLVFNYCNTGHHQVFTRSWLGRRESTWGVGFTTATDFDPLGDQFAYDQSIAAIKDAARDLEQTRATITMEVKKASRQLDRSYKRILLQEEQIHSSQGELHLSKLKFDRGMANNFDVIQAEKNFRNAEQTYWNALIDHIIGEYQLLAAIGLLTDKPCIK